MNPPQRFRTHTHLSTCIFSGFFLVQKKFINKKKGENASKVRKSQEKRLELSARQLLGNRSIEVAGFSVQSKRMIKLPNADFARKLRRLHLDSLLWLLEKVIFSTPFTENLEQVAAVSRAQSTSQPAVKPD